MSLQRGDTHLLFHSWMTASSVCTQHRELGLGSKKKQLEDFTSEILTVGCYVW